MRKHVFTTADGQTPDLHFEAGKCVCVRRGPEVTCPIAGNLSIRGVARPFALSLKVRQTSGQSVFKASGDAVVKLSDYEIPQPTQFGVKVSNEVKVRFDLTGRQSAAEITGDVR